MVNTDDSDLLMWIVLLNSFGSAIGLLVNACAKENGITDTSKDVVNAVNMEIFDTHVLQLGKEMSNGIVETPVAVGRGQNMIVSSEETTILVEAGNFILGEKDNLLHGKTNDRDHFTEPLLCLFVSSLTGHDQPEKNNEPEYM